MHEFLDKNGLIALVNRIKAELVKKANSNHTHSNYSTTADMTAVQNRLAITESNADYALETALWLEGENTTNKSNISSLQADMTKQKNYVKTVTSNWQFGSTHQINLPKKISECNSGLTIVWSGYNVSTSTVLDYYYQTTFIPKEFVTLFGGGKGFICPLVKDRGGAPVTKYVYVSDAYIKGHDDNASTTVNAGNNRSIVIRAVFMD